MALKTKIIIASTTIKDDDGAPDPALVIDFEYESVIESEISELVIRAPRSILDTITLVENQRVQMWKGFTTSTDKKEFDGFISKYKPEGGIIEITCKDKAWDLVRKNVNKIYFDSEVEAGQISAIAEDLIEDRGGLTATVQATGTSDGDTIEQFKCLDVDIWGRLLELAKAVDYQIWYEASTDLVHFEPRGFTDSGKTLTVGTEIIGVPTWENDTDQMVNDLKVRGAVVETINSESGQIGVTTNFTTTGITLTFVPETTELFLDSSNPPTTLRLGGSKDGSTGNYYYVDAENKKIIPSDTTGTFPSNDFAKVNYTFLAPAPVRMRNETSITTYGEFVDTLTFTDIYTIADAETRAINILARFSQPFRRAEILVKSDTTINLDVGNTVTIIDNINKPNINQEFVITKKKLKYPGSHEEWIVGDKELKLADWQVMTEERIKRLEEQFLRNQDIVAEIVQAFNDTSDENARKFWPRYDQIQSQAYTTGDNTMIWNNFDHGIWNTDNWATGANPDGFDDAVDHFIQSFTEETADKHTENFIDTDFKDTVNTTATWGTTGSVVFGVGQQAYSLSVDFNNGTITKATLNATIVSGTPSWRMSADGGANWETVTAGTEHTFTNTGTDLRWRANVLGAAEVSQVVVSDYH